MGPAQDEEKAGGGDPNIVALLSLQLLLLAFFILLNAISSYEEQKVEQVVSSVNQAFDGRVAAPQDLADVEAAVGPLPGSVQLSRRVRNLFASTLPMARIEQDEQLGELRIEIPTDSLFAADDPRLRAAPAVLFNRLARALGPERPEDLEARLEVLVGVAADALSALGTQPQALPVLRAGELARSLAARGLPAERLSVGILPGAEGWVRLVLRLADRPGVESQEAES